MNEKDLLIRGLKEIVKVFGREYAKANYFQSMICQTFINGGKSSFVFQGFKAHDELLDKQANERGWVAYGQVVLDAETGEMQSMEYKTEEGTERRIGENGIKIEQGGAMLDEKFLYFRGVEELIKVFGRKYLVENSGTSCTGRSFYGDEPYVVFTGIKGKSDLPDRQANAKGWVVYGQVKINPYTGELIHIEYQKE